MDKITRATRAQPARITPTKNNNQFAALAPSDSAAESNSDTGSYIKEAYLPNQPIKKDKAHKKVEVIEDIHKVTTSVEDKPQTDDWSSMSSSTTKDKTDVIS